MSAVTITYAIQSLWSFEQAEGRTNYEWLRAICPSATKCNGMYATNVNVAWLLLLCYSHFQFVLLQALKQTAQPQPKQKYEEEKEDDEERKKIHMNSKTHKSKSWNFIWCRTRTNNKQCSPWRVPFSRHHLRWHSRL